MPFAKNPLFNDIPRPASIPRDERQKIIKEAFKAADDGISPLACPYADDDRMDLWLETHRTRTYNA